jgi:hypothetical protein
MLRVFICTSHLSSLLMTLHARNSHQPGQVDVLLVDKGLRRADVIAAIRKVSSLHPWALFSSLSAEADPGHDFQPGGWRRFVRKWKEHFLVRPIYNRLLAHYQKKQAERIAGELRELLGPFIPGNGNVLLHVHTECQILQALMHLFPGAGVNYFEHGLGDYVYWDGPGLPKGDFHALFAAPFKEWVANRGGPTDRVLPLAIGVQFEHTALEVLVLSGQGVMPENLVNKPVVYVLMEAVDMYQVPDSFWAAYMDHILNDLVRPQDMYFVLKPHPQQSLVSIERTVERLRQRGIDHLLLDGPQFGLAAEVSFAAWAPQVSHVYCLVSTACFYLSVLYPDRGITFHYSVDFLERHAGHAPPMYQRLLADMKPLIRDVLAQRCVSY